MSTNTDLKLVKIGINTYKEAIIYMRKDCHVCVSEGFEVHTRIRVTINGKSILATLNIIENGILKPGFVSLSNYAWDLLEAKEGDKVCLSHPEPLTSLSFVRSKIYGNELPAPQIQEIISDISNGLYSDIHIATFLTACAGGRLSTGEITSLTNAMVAAGDKLNWAKPLVVDKHSVGGLPGNRTTPIVVPIVTSFGLTMPKTSSRAITSPAGTADVMETLTNVELDINKMKQVVEKEHGCMAWGGGVTLSPADDELISVERAIDLDSEGQLIASVLSKKIAAGSTHVLIDIPVGSSAKVRSEDAANMLKTLFISVASALNLKLDILLSDGRQPIGNGIGPSLEALDVMAVLKNEKNAPQDLKNKALMMAGSLIEFSGEVNRGAGRVLAQEILESGKAWDKFQRICEAQGGLKQPTRPKYTFEVKAEHAGILKNIDNRNLARLAKLAGAPHDKAAGLMLHAHLDDKIEKGQPLYTLCAETKGELEYAKSAIKSMPDIFILGE